MDATPSELLRAHFADVQASLKIPNLAYGLTVDGERVAAHERALPFRIASMTKSFTAAAVLLLRDRGLLKLDQPIVEWVPELASLRVPTTDSPEITVRHLLTMSAGIANDDPWADRLLNADYDTMQRLFSEGAHFAVAPGTRYIYCNYGYAMLGRAITNVAAMPFQQFISSELLEPLAMTSTTWDLPSGQHALPFRIRDEEAVPDDPPLSDGGFGAMGGLWSTVDDLLTWVHFLMDAFPARDGADEGPLLRSSRREMQQMARVIGIEKASFIGEHRDVAAGYGMGLRAFDDCLMGSFVSHSGGLPGYGSNMVWSEKRGLAIVSLANVTYARMSKANLDAIEILRRNHLLPPERRESVESIESYASELVALLNNWDDGRADEIFAMNVALDDPYDHRRAALAEEVSDCGPLSIRKVTALNAAAADVLVVDKDGRPLDLEFSLSSQATPRIQEYELKRRPKQLPH